MAETKPKIKIDWEKVDQFLMAGSPGTEVAAYLGMHPDTFYRRCEEENGKGFTDYLQEKRSKGDALLRSQQFAKSLGLNAKGDTTMMIWLGKNRLGQRDTPLEIEMSSETIKQFSEVMTQLNKLQSDASSNPLKIDESSNISE